MAEPPGGAHDMPKVQDPLLEQAKVEAIVLGLALLDKQSCGYDGTRIPDSCTCIEHDCLCHSHGFKVVHGIVAEFPMLQEPCPGCLSPTHHPVNTQPLAGLTCLCHGRGWLPVTTTDALLEAGKPWKLGVHWNGRAYQSGTKEADTANGVLALALEAARKGEAADAN